MIEAFYVNIAFLCQVNKCTFKKKFRLAKWNRRRIQLDNNACIKLLHIKFYRITRMCGFYFGMSGVKAQRPAVLTEVWDIL